MIHNKNIFRSVCN